VDVKEAHMKWMKKIYCKE
jgi:hypothetical protein